MNDGETARAIGLLAGIGILGLVNIASFVVVLTWIFQNLSGLDMMAALGVLMIVTFKLKIKMRDR